MLKTAVLTRTLAGLIAGLAGTAHLSAQELRLVVPENLLLDLEAYLHGRKAEEITSYASPQANRAVIEHVVLLQALKRAGITQPVTYSRIGSYDRQKVELIQGHAFANGTFYWLDDLDSLRNEIYLLDPVLPDGHFVVGLYTTPGNAKAMGVKRAKEIQGLSAVTNLAWTRDYAVLKKLNLARIETTPLWSNMLRMVNGGHADFTLMPFGPRPDMSVQTTEGFLLMPIPGFKVAIPGERGFVVSKAWPGSADLKARLQTALSAMIAEGTVRRAFRETGFVDDPRIKDWAVLP